MNKPIVVLIDAVSSGRYLKKVVIDQGYELILVNTLTQEQLAASGKNGGSTVEVLNEFYSTSVEQVEYTLLPYKGRIKGIIAASEPGVDFADILSYRFGLPGNLPSTTKFRRNKFEMRQVLQGSPYVVNYKLCTRITDVESFLEIQHCPVVVKALNSAGNDHVYFCDSKEDALIAAHKAFNSTTIFGNEITELMVEEYIDGDLILVEFFAAHGEFLVTSLWRWEMVEIKETHTRIFKNAVRLDHHESSYQPLCVIAEEIAQRTGVIIGPGLLELKVNPATGGCKLIEIGSRLSGIDLPVIQRESTDFDPYGQVIACFVSSKYELPNHVRLQGFAELYFAAVPKSGILVHISGIEEIKRLNSFHSLKVISKAGAWIEQTKDQATLAAVFTLLHADDKQIQDDKREIDRLFELVYA